MFKRRTHLGQIKRKRTCFSARRVVGTCKCHVTVRRSGSTTMIARWRFFLRQVYLNVQGTKNLPDNIIEMLNCRYNPCLVYTTTKLGIGHVWCMWSVY